TQALKPPATRCKSPAKNGPEVTDWASPRMKPVRKVNAVGVCKGFKILSTSALDSPGRERQDITIPASPRIISRIPKSGESKNASTYCLRLSKINIDSTASTNTPNQSPAMSKGAIFLYFP